MLARVLKHIYLLTICCLSGCIFDGYEESITEDFEVGWIDMRVNRNLYHQHLGIFTGRTLTGVLVGDSNIFIATKPWTDQEIPEYFILNIEGYKKDPTQSSSSALQGPLNLREFTGRLSQIGAYPSDLDMYE